MANWTVYKKQRGQRNDAATITIGVHGALAISPAAMQLLGAPERAFLVYDETAHLIGILPDPDGCPESYSLKASSSGAAVLSAVKLLRQLGIKMDRSRRLPAAMDGGALAFRWAEPLAETARA